MLLQAVGHLADHNMHILADGSSQPTELVRQQIDQVGQVAVEQEELRII